MGGLPCSISPKSRPPCARTGSTAGCCTPTFAGSMCSPGAFSTCRPTEQMPVAALVLLFHSRASGEPRRLVHRIEAAALDHVPGSKSVYLRWQELEAGVQSLVQGAKKVAMEYVPRNANPYVSRVDAGTLELEVRSVRRRDRAVGRSDPAFRGVLGRRAMGDAPRGGPHMAARRMMSPSVSSRTMCARRTPFAKPRCKR